MRMPLWTIITLFMLSTAAGCGSTATAPADLSVPEPDPGLLRANELPAGADRTQKCASGETLICESRYRVSDGRHGVGGDDTMAQCSCRPMTDLRNIW
ncbi:MAG: hypothetical protein OEW35_08860 [Gammaproteobacteria bacterium]|nr:hypothetical protein [Gammaproteobacteria bacterium]MDH4253572.1 hypothetical protein [Gammaproteobacteria bacterium]MDH5310157.1 hypothetical protein [Gammaproteobacteria bacterium]